MAAHNDSPLLIEGPKATAQADSPIIDLQSQPESAPDEQAKASEGNARWHLPTYAPLGAAIAFAVAIGAVAGAAATSGLMRDTSPAVADTTRALHDSVAQLGTEIAALKASSQRTTGKLAERIDRTEKAQAEPAAKLAKIQESLERLDRKQVAAAPASDITGSVAPKDESKPQVVEGWRLRDYYDGRAVVENRNGTLYKIAPGANVPGLGKVEAIKREHGKVVVVTANGIIASSPEQRRPYYMPRW